MAIPKNKWNIGEKSKTINEAQKERAVLIGVVQPPNSEEKIIEYMLQDKNDSRLVNMPLSDFADETASESPAPGGGSIAAYIGSLGVSLATMVANLSSHKKGWDDRWEEFSNWAEKGQQ